MVCQVTEDHVEMNISQTGSEAALYEASGLEWNQILTLREKASGICHITKLWHLTSQPASGTMICCFLIPHKAALAQRKTGSSFSQKGISDPQRNLRKSHSWPLRFIWFSYSQPYRWLTSTGKSLTVIE